MQKNHIISKPSERLQIFLSDFIIEKEKKEFKYCDDQSIEIKLNKNINYRQINKLENNKHIIENEILKKIKNTDLNLQNKQDNIIEEKNIEIKNTLFLINLDFDKRIKSYKQIDKLLTIEFWSVSECISFYKQYIVSYDMKFINKWQYKYGVEIERSVYQNYPWREPNCNLAFYNNITHPCKMTLQVKYKKIDVKPKKINDGSCFALKVEYFKSLSKHFDAYELKVMQLNAENEDYDFIFRNTKELAVGLSTNMLFQETLKNLSKKDLVMVINRLGYDIGPIAATKYGAYVIQTLITLIKDKDEQDLIINYIKNNIIELLKHPIGNYSAQAIANFDSNFLFEIFIDNMTELLNDDLGFKVFKNCLTFFESQNSLIKKKIKQIKKSKYQKNQRNFTVATRYRNRKKY
ncbi:hypothetical protein GVAV_000329 [Gurleya vavrai]